jgi:tetratricopeptide (TPR) repeat protein
MTHQMKQISDNHRTNKQFVSFSSILTLIILTISLFLSCVGPRKVITYDKAYKFDRAAFGTSKLNFWYALTDFEIMALENYEKAISGDPEALLALAVFSSGNVRNMEVYHQYHKKVTDFVKKIKPAVDKENGVYEKGNIIFSEMCKVFINDKPADTELKGYRYNQSQITELLRTGKFNCISSALLYMILARFFDLDVWGAEVPSHIFLHIKTPDEKLIDIETTTKRGYGFTHDREYYKRKAKSWSTKRNLVKGTYEEYLRRIFHKPYELICFNMINQHTADNRMATFDRNRLLEAMGYIYHDNKTSQKNRLIVYNNEYNHLKNRGEFATLYRMHSKIQLFLPELKKRWPKDHELLNFIAWIEYQYAYTLLKNKKTDNLTETIEELLISLKSELRDYNTLLNNCLSLIFEYSAGLIEKNNFNESLLLLNNFHKYDITKKLMNNAYMWLYENQAGYHWDKDDWRDAIEYYSNALNYVNDENDTKRINKNIEGAYCNWAKIYFDNDSTAHGLEILEECTQKYPQAKKCRTVLKQFKKWDRLKQKK